MSLLHHLGQTRPRPSIRHTRADQRDRASRTRDRITHHHTSRPHHTLTRRDDSPNLRIQKSHRTEHILISYFLLLSSRKTQSDRHRRCESALPFCSYDAVRQTHLPRPEIRTPHRPHLPHDWSQLTTHMVCKDTKTLALQNHEDKIL